MNFRLKDGTSLRGLAGKEKVLLEAVVEVRGEELPEDLRLLVSTAS